MEEKRKKILVLGIGITLLVFGVSAGRLLKSGGGKESTENLATNRTVAPKKLLEIESVPLDEQDRNIVFSPETALASLEIQEPPRPVTLIAVGDVMVARAVGAKMKKMNDWKWPFRPIADYLLSADIVFGNLETPITETGTESWEGNRFMASPKVSETLTFAGFDFLSVANNHMGDQKRAGMENTFATLRDLGIEYVGGGYDEEEAHTAKIQIVNGTRFGFLGYTDIGPPYSEAADDTSGIALLKNGDTERLVQDIHRAKEITDFLVVSMHFGTEYQTASNARQQRYARTAIDAGANLVIGHHPHLPQEIEYYGNGAIIYSLGNFIFDQTWSDATMRGLTVQIIIEKNRIVDIEKIPVRINGAFQVELDKKEESS